MGRGGAHWNQGRGNQFVPPQQQGPGFPRYQDFQEGYGNGRGAQFLPDPRGMFPQSEPWMSGQQMMGQTFAAPIRSPGFGRPFESNMPQQNTPSVFPSGSKGSVQSNGGVQNPAQIDVLGDAGKGAGATDVTKACKRCADPGHIAKDCKAILSCINCGLKNAHLSSKCGMVTRARRVVQLVGCAHAGLQMLVAKSSRKPEEGDTDQQVTGVVTVITGKTDASQLREGFNRQFPWGADWKISNFGSNMFLASFPSRFKLEGMSAFDCFGLRESSALVKVTEWSPTSTAKFKVYTVWVRVIGVPETLLNEEGFDEIGSMLGIVQRCAMKVKVLQWHAVASWTWDAQDETCGICRMAFDGCCPDCKFPGDDCPIIWGACNHAFHLHYILKWVNSQTSTPLCPMCRREWQFKG
ncbi:hypothetical protein ACQ4PT_064806 [Festuca glaucescens]